VRIISGKYRGRNVIAPASLPVRPTTDFAKTGLFNLLNNRIRFEAISALDLFTGTGNITYELISRGCSRITAVDIDARCVRFVKETALKMEAVEVKVIKADVFRYLDSCNFTFDFIFADPPFEMEHIDKLPALINKHQLLNQDGIFVLEHISGRDLSPLPGFREVRKYGHVSFSFFDQVS